MNISILYVLEHYSKHSILYMYIVMSWRVDVKLKGCCFNRLENDKFRMYALNLLPAQRVISNILEAWEQQVWQRESGNHMIVLQNIQYKAVCLGPEFSCSNLNSGSLLLTGKTISEVPGPLPLGSECKVHHSYRNTLCSCLTEPSCQAHPVPWLMLQAPTHRVSTVMRMLW